jgi:NADH:ubiquinone oxidoreductase subunit 5 (subunit L)/multisubunit Na+/H+ antiporter MnhA subunit
MLVAIWLSHHLLHENINFNKLNQLSFMDGILNASHYWGIIISILFVTAAVVKSAQFPFSSWLPRAMEGPTNSSAIFYGSLSVHLGAFLLLRTYPFWHHYDAVKTLIMVIGALTVIMASVTSSVQSTVKTQIAYSSIVQIGIIFIEIALGWHLLALVHFAGNAFLRTYQLLISPSVLNYLIHDQFYNYEKKPMKKYPMWIQRLRHTFFVLGLREWDLDFFQSRFMWLPFKKLGKHLKWLNNRWSLFLVILLIVTGAGYGFYPGRKHGEFYHTLTIVYAIIGMFLIIRAFTERENASRAWTMLTGSQLLVALSIALNEHVAVHQIVIYLSGVLVSSIVGYMCIKRLNYLENGSSLNNYHGHIYEHPRIGIVFLLACLGMAGFPFTPTFLGIDLLFSHIHPDQYFLAIFNAVGFVFLELSVLRIYSRLFLGPHIKTYHEIAYKSS